MERTRVREFSILTRKHDEWWDELVAAEGAAVGPADLRSPGKQGASQFVWFPKRDLWASFTDRNLESNDPDDPKGYRMTAFGLGDPTTREGQAIVVEVNFAYAPPRNCRGRLARRSDGKYDICRVGQLGGFYRHLALESYEALDWVDVSDKRRDLRAARVCTLGTPEMLDDLEKFVRAVKAIKSGGPLTS